LTYKLKNETNLPANIISHLRTAQLATIGFLVAAMPPYKGLDAKLFNINTMEELMLLGMGLTGLFLNYQGVNLVNKMDSSRLYRFISANLQAVTELPTNIIRRLVGKRPNEYQFMNWDEITDMIRDEIAGLTREIRSDIDDLDDRNEVVSNGDERDVSAPVFIRHPTNSCLSYLRLYQPK
jgi:hypothetical protein